MKATHQAVLLFSNAGLPSPTSAFSPRSASTSLPSSSSPNKDAGPLSGAGVISNVEPLNTLQSKGDEKTTRGCRREASFEKNGDEEQQEFAPPSALASSTQEKYQHPNQQGDDYWHLLHKLDALRQSKSLTVKDFIAIIEDTPCSIKGSELNSALLVAAKILITIKSSADNRIQDDAAENQECAQPTALPSSSQAQHKHPNRIAVPGDEAHLTAYHCYARANLLELFEKDGRIGFRCAYCSSGHRGHFPKDLDTIYKTFCSSFLSEGKHLHTCKKIPAKVKKQYAKFKDGSNDRGNKSTGSSLPRSLAWWKSRRTEKSTFSLNAVLPRQRHRLKAEEKF